MVALRLLSNPIRDIKSCNPMIKFLEYLEMK